MCPSCVPNVRKTCANELPPPRLFVIASYTIAVHAFAPALNANAHPVMIVCCLIIVALLPLMAVSFAALPHMLRGMPRTHIVLHSLFPLSQAAFIGVQLYYALRTRDLPYTIVLVCCSPMCAGIDVLLVKHLIAAEQRDREHDRLRLLELQAEAQRRRMQDFDDASTHLRDDYHDFLNKLDDLDCTLREGAPLDQVERDVHNASDAFGTYAPQLCGNLVADALLSMKMREAHHNGIRFDCEVSVEQQTPLSDVELCAVFANMCDNALHACEALRAAGDAPWVRVRARIDARHCLVEVSNAYTGMGSRHGSSHRRPPADEHPDLREHGWGCSILESIAARHGGIFVSAPSRDRWAARFSC